MRFGASDGVNTSDVSLTPAGLVRVFELVHSSFQKIIPIGPRLWQKVLLIDRVEDKNGRDNISVCGWSTGRSLTSSSHGLARRSGYATVPTSTYNVRTTGRDIRRKETPLNMYVHDKPEYGVSVRDRKLDKKIALRSSKSVLNCRIAFHHCPLG